MKSKKLILVCSAILLGTGLTATSTTLINNHLNIVKAADNDSDKVDAKEGMVGLTWNVKDDTREYGTLQMLEYLNKGEITSGNAFKFANDLPEGFEYTSVPNKIYSNGSLVTKYSGTITRKYSVKPDPNSAEKSVKLQYVDPQGNVIKEQELKGKQGETINVKYDLPNGWDFDAHNDDSLFVAMPNATYTFATENPVIKIPMLKVDQGDGEKGKILVHYLDRNGKEFDQQMLFGTIGESFDVPYKYPSNTLVISSANILIKNEDSSDSAGKIVDHNDPKYKKNSDAGFPSALAQVTFTKDQQDVYVTVDNTQQKVKPTKKPQPGSPDIKPSKPNKKNDEKITYSSPIDPDDNIGNSNPVDGRANKGNDQNKSNNELNKKTNSNDQNKNDDANKSNDNNDKTNGVDENDVPKSPINDDQSNNDQNEDKSDDDSAKNDAEKSDDNNDKSGNDQDSSDTNKGDKKKPDKKDKKKSKKIVAVVGNGDDSNGKSGNGSSSAKSKAERLPQTGSQNSVFGSIIAGIVGLMTGIGMFFKRENN